MRYVQDATEGAMRKNTRFYTRKRLGGGIMAMGDDGVRGWPCRLGTVGYAVCPTISTVPFPIFCKRHGRLHRLCRDFDRAFDVFLQKARSCMTAAPRFRPCLWRFFAKGTVGCARCPAISTVPLAIFCKRHGRLRPLPCNFDRAFDDFLRKARSVTPAALRFRPCLCRFFAKGTVAELL